MTKLYFNRRQYDVRLMEDLRYAAVDLTVRNFIKMIVIEVEHLKQLIEPNVKKINTISEGDFSY